MIFPETWKTCNISDVMIVERGASPRPIKEYLTNLKDGVNWIKIGDADKDEKYIYSTHEKIKKEGVLKSRFVHNGDLLLSNSMSFGRPYILKTSGCIHDGWLVLHLKSSQLSVDFFYYQLLSQSVYLQFSNLAAGAVVKNLNSDAVKHVEIVVPPLAEQERIVAKIEELFAGIDAGVENLKSVKNQIALYRQSVLKSAFTNQTKKEMLKNFIIEINYGTSEKTNDDASGIPVLRMGDIQNGKLRFNKLKYLKKITDKKLLLQKGDLLFNRTNSAELVGKSAVFNSDFVCSFASYLIKVRFSEKLNSDYVCFYINSPYGKAWAKTQLTQQVGQANINSQKLQALQIPIPTLAEQERIVAEIESRFERADALETAVDRALNDAEKLKQAVLKKAFSGELVPQNPDDEPASVLLARIRAARASEQRANPQKGKQKR